MRSCFEVCCLHKGSNVLESKAPKRSRVGASVGSQGHSSEDLPNPPLNLFTSSTERVWRQSKCISNVPRQVLISLHSQVDKPVRRNV